MSWRRIYVIGMLAGAALLSVSGCRTHRAIRSPEYADVQNAVVQASYSANPVAAAVSEVAGDLAGPHSVDDYVQYALANNAGLQAARSRVVAAAERVPQAAALDDPMLDVNAWPFFPHVPQTAAGRMTADVMVSQQLPWFGKRSTRAAAAEEEANAARTELAAAVLETVEQVKRSYFQLHFVEQSLRITRKSRELLSDVLELAKVRYETGGTSQQDVLRLQAELAGIDGDIVRLEQEMESARAELAALLHISPDTPLETLDSLQPAGVPQHVDQLYQQAIAARPELHTVLAELERNRRMVELAHLNYRPDMTWGIGWGDMTTRRALAPTADGIDNVNTSLSLNLPLYGKRLDAAVREAEAEVVASARQYDQLRDQTLREVKSLHAQALGRQEQARLFRDSILPNTEQALDLSIREYQVGQITFAQVVDNWRELLRWQLMHQQLEAELRQTLASLARVVGTVELQGAAFELPQPAE